MRRELATIGTALWIASLAACAAQTPQLSREEWLAVTTRSYPDHTPAEILDAARQVFVLADGDDFSFAYPDEHSMTASRAWIVYAVFSGMSGVDVWHVSADEGGRASVTLEAAVWPVRTQDVYELFWARMDYLLGRSDHWPTCEGHEQMAWDKPNGIDALCSPWNIKDTHPTDGGWRWTTTG